MSLSTPELPPETLVIRPKLALPADLADHALARVKEILKGNGLNTDQFHFVEIDGELLKFEGQLTIDLTPQIVSRTEAGRQQKGEIIDATIDFNAHMQKALLQFTQDTPQRKIILEDIQKRPDQGFGVRDDQMILDRLKKTYTAHDICGSCKGQGKTICGTCNGQKMVTCHQCHGRKDILCPACRGQGRLRDAKGNMVTCARCQGRGRLPCPTCQARGVVPCPKCKGQGFVSCGTCAGSGIVSHVADVSVVAKLHFDYDRTHIPMELQRKLDALGGQLKQEGDLHIQILGPVSLQTDDDLAAQNKNPKFGVRYSTTLPYASAQLCLRRKKDGSAGQIVFGKIMGYNAQLVGFPAVLDDLTAKAQLALQQSALGQGHVAQTLRHVARQRVVRDILKLTARGKEARSLISTILKIYPSFLTAGVVARLSESMRQNFRTLHQKPFAFSLKISVLAGFLLSLLGLLGLMRLNGIKHIALSPVQDMVLLALPALLSLGFSYAVSEIFLQRNLIQNLKGLIPVSELQKWKNHIPYSHLWRITASLVPYFIVAGGFYAAGWLDLSSVLKP
jgi:hypothetical protein